MKKLIALVLTLVLLLTILPMAVLATDAANDGSAPTNFMEQPYGLYRSLRQEVLYDEIAMTHEENAHYYAVGYPANEGMTLFYWNQEIGSLTVSGTDHVTVELVNSEIVGLYMISLAPTSGTVNAQFQTDTQGGFPIVFSDGSGDSGNGGNSGDELTPGVYTEYSNGQLSGHRDMSNNGPYYEVAYADGGVVFYFWHPQIVAPEFRDQQGTGNLSVETVESEAWTGLYRITLTEASGNIRVTFAGTGGESNPTYQIRFSDSSSGGTDDSNALGAVIAEQHATTDEEKLAEYIPSDGMVPFTFGEQVYYFSVITLTDEESGTFRETGGTSSPPAGGENHWKSAIGFWMDTPEGKVLVNEEIRADILAAFGDTLSLELYAVRNDHSVNFKDYAACYPHTDQWAAFGWPCGVRHIFTDDTAGTWLYVASGTINGVYVEYSTEFVYEPRISVETDEIESIADVNTMLQEFAANEENAGKTCTINLPAGELYGIIEVPEGLYLVDIYGSTNGGTTIYGGVHVGSHVILNNIAFEGADSGKEHAAWERGWSAENYQSWLDDYIDSNWSKTWPADGHEALAGQPNYAVWGKTGVLYNECSFVGYYHAFENVECIHFGGDNSDFVNNGVAIYFDTMGEAGNLQMTNNRFIRNGVAFRFESETAYMPAQYVVLRCQFRDNLMDVFNHSGLRFFLPGNYFAWQGQYEHVSSGDQTVFAFPYAKDPSWTDFDYSAEVAVTLNSQAGDWLIPEADLTEKTIILVDGTTDGDLATWEFAE